MQHRRGIEYDPLPRIEARQDFHPVEIDRPDANRDLADAAIGDRESEGRGAVSGDGAARQDQRWCRRCRDFGAHRKSGLHLISGIAQRQSDLDGPRLGIHSIIDDRYVAFERLGEALDEQACGLVPLDLPELVLRKADDRRDESDFLNCPPTPKVLR